MALSPSALASLIQGNLAAQGANGSNLAAFCTGVATGVVMSIVGQSFATSDVGLTPGPGAGMGVGIIGLSASAMSSTALGLMSSQGSNASVLMDAIMNAVVAHLATATLVSVDVPVYSGIGMITVGSITVVPSVMGSNIDAQLQAQGAQGANRTNLANAIGTGIATGILSSGTGTLTITGSPTIPVPVPGTGNGVGTIS